MASRTDDYSKGVGETKADELVADLNHPTLRMKSGLLLDLDGVIYQSGEAIEGAVEAVRWVQVHGIPHRFVTNTSSVPRSVIVERPGHFGIETSVDQIICPPAAASHWITTHQPGPAALFVSEATRSEFEGLEILDDDIESGAGAVVIGDLGQQWDFETLNRAFLLLIASDRPALLALGMTRFWRTDERLTLDVGPYVKALEYAAGTEAIVLGKPADGFFWAAVEQMGVLGDETWMIGDDLVGDIDGAHNAGLAATLVRTGKFRESDLDSSIRPDAILDSIADLPNWWAS